MNSTLSLLGVEARRRLSRIGLAFSAFFAVTLLVQLGLAALLRQAGAFDNAPLIDWLLSMVPMYLFGFPVFYLILRPLSQKKLAARRLEARDFFIFLFIAYTLLYLGNLVGTVINAVTNLLAGAQSSADATEIIGESSLWLVFLFAVILGPLVEEVMFRGLILRRLLPFGEGFAILASALLFGLFHGNLSQFIYAFLLGTLFGFLHCRTGKLWHTILLHAAVNFMGSILPLTVLRSIDPRALSGELPTVPEELAPLIPSLLLLFAYGIAVFAITVTGAYLLYRYRKVFLPGEDFCLLPRGERRKVFLSVGFALALLTSLSMIVLSYL